MSGEGDRLPSGTVTFLFTDMEGSTRRWEAYRELMPERVARHDRVLGEAIAAVGGRLVKHLGDGLMAVFADAHGAVEAAIAGQRAIAAEIWEPVPDVKVRMGIHSGRASPSGGDYFGDEVNRAARVADTGHGGQVVLSGAAAAMVESAGVGLEPLGRHQLKDLSRPLELFQLVADGLERDFPPLRTLELTTHDLPPQRTSFVGRTSELADVRDAIRGSRLTTVVGPGGVGKTRLSLHAAAEVAASFADGVRFVELAPVDRPDDVVGTLLDRLSAADVPAASDDPLFALAKLLRGRELLIVLDNCEHQKEATAHAVDALLDSCPTLTIVATSRTPLGLNGETVVNLEPFAVSAQPTEDDDAIRLFLDRAHAKGATTESMLDDLEAVSETCRMVDGLPVGIELAAAHAHHLTPRGIWEHLERHTKLLVSRDTVANERHRSLETLLDWSYELLEPVEREVLCRLGVIAAPVTLEQIEQVVTGDGVDRDDVLGVLASLVDKSLLRADTDEWPARYSMLRLVHRFALDRLARSGRLDVWRSRHAGWVLESISGGEEAAPGDADARLRTFMERSSEELAAALSWADEAGRHEIGWRLIAAGWRWWEMRGRARDGLDLIERFVHPDDRVDDIAWAQAVEGIANLAFTVGDMSRSRQCHLAAIEVFERHGAIARAAWCRTGLSMTQLLSGDRGAEETAQLAFRQFEATGDVRGIGHARSSLGMIATRAGEHERAERLYLDALAVLRPAGERRDAASVLSNLGNLAEDRGELRRATRYYDGAIQLYREVDDRRGVALILNNLSIVAQRTGDLLRAETIAREALAVFRSIGDTAGEAAVLNNLSNLAAARGDHAGALQLCRDGIEAFKRCADARGVVTGLRNAAALAGGLGLDGMAWNWHVDAAALLTRLGMLGEAASELTAIAELADTHGLGAASISIASADGTATTLLTVLDRLRDQGPVDRNAAPDEIPDGFGELTARELELLALVGEGLGNGEIAEQLYISPRTVDAHLSHIRAKLGISERSKLIVAARTVAVSSS
ncbi:MAG: tetratricopeptide repeat protein [Ilumatobacter sp.]|nr:tetratricopeptide repeat protein [Ilumatobacter sp.]